MDILNGKTVKIHRFHTKHALLAIRNLQLKHQSIRHSFLGCHVHQIKQLIEPLRAQCILIIYSEHHSFQKFIKNVIQINQFHKFPKKKIHNWGPQRVMLTVVIKLKNQVSKISCHHRNPTNKILKIYIYFFIYSDKIKNIKKIHKTVFEFLTLKNI